MKSVEELNAIKAEYKNNVEIRTDEKPIKVIVGMGNSGIVSGARDILHQLVKLIADNNLGGKVLVMQEARVSLPQHNPVVKIVENGNEVATYSNVTTDIAEKIVNQHLINGKILEEYLLK